MIIDIRKPKLNTARKFGAAKFYYGGVIIDSWGKKRAALFTAEQINDAISRAMDNPEDAPDARPLWKRLFGIKE